MWSYERIDDSFVLDLAKSTPECPAIIKGWAEVAGTTRSRYLCYGDYREF